MSNLLADLAQQKLKEIAQRGAKGSFEIERDRSLREVESGQAVDRFISWLKDNARTERNIKVKVEPWVIDHMSLFGDLRLNKVVVAGSAQVIKSLGAFLTTYFLTEKLYLNVLFTFAKSTIRNKLVASTLKPLYIYNDAAIANPLEPVADNTLQRTTAASTLYTSFVNVPQVSDAIAVSPELASISVDVVMVDEFSLCDPKIVALLSNRQNASALEFKPFRLMSTPGREGMGIDREIAKCDLVFAPHVHCPHCGGQASLDPRLCFLLPKKITTEGGYSQSVYYDEDFRIVDWNKEDDADPINSAYIRCHLCDGKLTQEMLQTARLLEEKTLLNIEQFKASVTEDPFRLRTVGVRVSPFLRRTKSYIAPRLINEAIATENPTDFLQQKLGIATSSDTDGISIRSITECIDADSTPQDPHLYDRVRLLGLDQARGSHYTCLGDCYIPKMGSKQERFKRSVISVRSFNRVSTTGLHEYIRTEGVDFAAFDLAPDFSFAADFTKQYRYIPVLQKKAGKEVLRVNEATEYGGISIASIDVGNQYFLTDVVKLFSARGVDGEKLLRLPNALRSQLVNPGKHDPVNHFTSLEFDPERELWQKAGNSRCDSVYTLLFLRVALYYHIFNRKGTGWLEFFG